MQRCCTRLQLGVSQGRPRRAVTESHTLPLDMHDANVGLVELIRRHVRAARHATRDDRRDWRQLFRGHLSGAYRLLPRLEKPLPARNRDGDVQVLPARARPRERERDRPLVLARRRPSRVWLRLRLRRTTTPKRQGRVYVPCARGC
jgi:hypothetical protein